jgi:hypothetical protein
VTASDVFHQERDDTSDLYTYETVSFGARSVSELLWELMDALADRLDGNGRNR